MSTPADRAYSNDRRAGRTHPDMVEIMARDDPRKGGRRPRPNRAEFRKVGLYRRKPKLLTTPPRSPMRMMKTKDGHVLTAAEKAALS